MISINNEREKKIDDHKYDVDDDDDNDSNNTSNNCWKFEKEHKKRRMQANRKADWVCYSS